MELFIFLIIIFLFVSYGRKKKKQKKQANSDRRVNIDNLVYESSINQIEPEYNRPTFRELQREAYPSRIGNLYPHEILALSLCDRYRVDKNKKIPTFWNYRYGVTNIDPILKKLQKKGFIEEEDVYHALSRQLVKTLKTVLVENNIKVGRNKTEMITSLKNNIPIEQLKQYFPSENYMITEEGKKVLNDNEYIPYVHANTDNFQIDIWKMNKLIYTGADSHWKEILWNYMQSMACQYFNNKEYGLYASIKYGESCFLADEKEYLKSLECIAEVINYDLEVSYYPYKMTKQEKYELVDNLGIGTSIIRDMKTYCDLLDYTDDQLRAIFKYKFCSNTHSVFTKEEKIGIVIAKRDGDLDTLNMLYNNAKARIN